MEGYYLYPNVLNDELAFTSDDDIWKVQIKGGDAIRLTSDMGIAVKPKFSQDGKWIAFLRKQMGDQNISEIYVMPADGGKAERLTYFGSPFTDLIGWKGDEIILSSDYHRPFSRWPELFSVRPSGGQPFRLPYGNATTAAFHDRITVIGRNASDITYWKRYRGGTWGRFWIDRTGEGRFEKFLDEIEGNLNSPCFADNRFYFISDHEGVGNVYSVDINGKDLKKHTNFTNYYARNASSDGKTVVVQSGGAIFTLGNNEEKIPIDLPSSRKGKSPKFVDVFRNLDDFQLHPNGKTSLLCVRGKPFVAGNYEGPVLQTGVSDGVRYRIPRFLPSGRSFVVVSDASGEEAVEVHDIFDRSIKTVASLGEIEAIEPSPKGNVIAISNNRFELWLVNLDDGSTKLVDKSQYGPISELAWRKDGNWLAYTFPEGHSIQSIKIISMIDYVPRRISTPTSFDFSPSFDAAGQYLYYLSNRSLTPSLDRTIFEMNFPRPIKPFLVVLEKKPSPFLKGIQLEPKIRQKENEGAKDAEKGSTTELEPIAVDGIMDRIEPIPVEEGNYSKLAGLGGGKLALLSFPQEGAQAGKPNGIIEVFDAETKNKEKLISGVSWFTSNGSQLLVRIGEQLRVVDPDKKVDQTQQEPGPRSGILDLTRIKVYVNPEKEWQQMLRETWRLMRDNYWNQDMNGLDWEAVYEKYKALLDKISTRFELSDLIKEMQGELGTSHAYEIGGEYDLDKPYLVGGLGAETKYNGGGYEIIKVFEGDKANEGEKSPLKSAGIEVGSIITEINGTKLTEQIFPEMLLLNRGGDPISIKVKTKSGEYSETVKTLKDERQLVYRDWVESNKRFVHEKSGGRVGYVHVPDMGLRGFAEFHRLYRVEVYKDGIIIDLRYNSGGFISSLIFEKIARKRLAEERPRRGVPSPYPSDAPPTAMAALINEATGSDGDIFSHAFKSMKLGPLIGTRTWGGVIGINPRRKLVDGTVVTQPQFAFFFNDIGLGLENRGEQPDIWVNITPQDYAQGLDPQLEEALERVLDAIKDQ